MRIGDSGEAVLCCDVTNGQATVDQTGDVGTEVDVLRDELRPRPQGDRRGVSMAGAGRATAFPLFFREGGGCVMISARGQFHNGGGPPSGGNTAADEESADRWGWGIWERADLGETTAALSPLPPALEDGPPPVAPQTAWMCSG
jgi:hypothetical protein